jgi:hypothetical protein
MHMHWPAMKCSIQPVKCPNAVEEGTSVVRVVVTVPTAILDMKPKMNRHVELLSDYERRALTALATVSKKGINASA